MASISNLGPGKYRITVYIGTKDGRKKRKRITWTAPVGMTQRQADKAVILEADRYEKDIKSSLGKFYGITLEEFSKIWLEEYAKKQLKESTISRYERMMDRINDSGREKLLKLINIMRYIMLGLIALTFISWFLPYFQYDKATHFVYYSIL